jgi:hypothetical protein
VGIPEYHRVPETIRPPDIEEQSQDGHRVPDQTDKRRGAGDGLVALEIEERAGAHGDR